uniref:Endonuclease/exonuclease/phosphatase domain-containing protein n=1 Tax=Pristionchus pacificus TaxID=54126 RepID=A0A8R1ZAH0_PRIPA
MIRWLLCAIVLLGLTSALRVMTFNVWNSGRHVKDGLSKIASQIRSINPDVVALQEIREMEHIGEITTLLGAGWSGSIHCKLDTAIITRHTIVPGSYAQVDRGMHVRIQIAGGNRQVSVWSMHLAYKSYGPYAAQNKQVTSEAQILAGEMPTTTPSRIARSEVVPVIVAGDFNVPSDEDWIEENRDAHGGWVIKWPTTQLLRNTSGMRDSYRQINSDPISDPGITWSVFKYLVEWDYTVPDPEDRIDFIFYRGSIKPTSSFTYSGSEQLRPMPEHTTNSWPSDHYSVVTDFEDIPFYEAPSQPMKRVDPHFISKHCDIIFEKCTSSIIRAYDEGNKVDRRKRHRSHAKGRA